MHLLKRLLDLLLYGSFWISLAAGAQVQLTYMLLDGSWLLDKYTAFICLGTLVLYSGHRLIGMEKVRQFEWQGRFAVIRKFRRHIAAYGLVAMIAGIYVFFKLPQDVRFILLVPVVAGALYISPLLPGRRRLRDLPLLKIFLIATTWSLLVATIPASAHSGTAGVALGIVFFERALFIFAITIPFDIRDMEVDRASSVVSIPLKFGVQRSKLLAMASLLLSATMMIFLTSMDVYAVSVLPVYFPFIAATSGLIWYSRSGRTDYYYSGILDGSMVVLPALYAALLALMD